jgi:ABC-type multidrug transport system permease subunit
MDLSRNIFYREQSSKMYSPYAFVTGMVTAEIPYIVLAAVLVCSTLGWRPYFVANIS